MIDRKNENIRFRMRGFKQPIKGIVVWSFAVDGELFHRVSTPARPVWIKESDLVTDEDLAEDPTEIGEGPVTDVLLDTTEN